MVGLAEAAAAFRQEVYRRELGREAQERAFAAFFDGTVDPELLRARVPAWVKKPSMVCYGK